MLEWLQRYGRWSRDSFVRPEDVPHRRPGPDPAAQWQRLDPTGLDPAALGPFLRWLDLSRPDLPVTPQYAELAVGLMLGESGQVSRVWRGVEARTWGQAEGAPSMPEETVVPHLVHSVWSGVEDCPAEVTRRRDGEADVVL
ncbi:hypothetical protein LWF15_20680 [Kineosporia rhizophila]|uniref:hypothetical protein n=1 Tax=Kineosporia rhizophila TaxID=84633 RepID=UPI001E4F85B2|nr:hypothetical protein [Kineosporia rhizophila]MCE0537913.1 hypothetical protein [Kineosporia rhizophila]